MSPQRLILETGAPGTPKPKIPAPTPHPMVQGEVGQGVRGHSGMGFFPFSEGKEEGWGEERQGASEKRGRKERGQEREAGKERKKPCEKLPKERSK